MRAPTFAGSLPTRSKVLAAYLARIACMPEMSPGCTASRRMRRSFVRSTRVSSRTAERMRGSSKVTRTPESGCPGGPAITRGGISGSVHAGRPVGDAASCTGETGGSRVCSSTAKKAGEPLLDSVPRSLSDEGDATVVAGVPGMLCSPACAWLEVADEDRLESRLLPAARGEFEKAPCEAETGLISVGCFRLLDGVVPGEPELELAEGGRGDRLPGPTELLPDPRPDDATRA